MKHELDISIGSCKNLWNAFQINGYCLLYFTTNFVKRFIQRICNAEKSADLTSFVLKENYKNVSCFLCN